MAGKAAVAYLGTPKLIRETSKPKPWSLLRRPPKGVDAAKGFSDVILPEHLQNHIAHLAASTSNTKKHGAPFRHMLFYGPPGTGKSLAAKRLARTSGLHYAILSGGDVAPLGGGAVTQLHELFDWCVLAACSAPFCSFRLCFMVATSSRWMMTCTGTEPCDRHCIVRASETLLDSPLEAPVCLLLVPSGLRLHSRFPVWTAMITSTSNCCPKFVRI